MQGEAGARTSSESRGRYGTGQKQVKDRTKVDQKKDYRQRGYIYSDVPSMNLERAGPGEYSKVNSACPETLQNLSLT